MKNYEEMSHSVLERRDKYNKRRRTRSTVIAAAACAAVAVGGAGTKILLDRNTKPFVADDGITLNAASAGASQENASGEWEYEFETYEGEGYFVTTLEDGTQIRTPVEVPAGENPNEFLKNALFNGDISEIEYRMDEISSDELWNFHTEYLEFGSENLGLDEADRVDMSFDELCEYYGVTFDVPPESDLMPESAGKIYKNDERGIYYDTNCLYHNYSDGDGVICITLSRANRGFETEGYKKWKNDGITSTYISRTSDGDKDYFRLEDEINGTYISVTGTLDMFEKLKLSTTRNQDSAVIHCYGDSLVHLPMQTDILEGFADLLSTSETPADPYSMKFTWVLDNQQQKIVSLFGYDEWIGGNHNGIDIAPIDENDSMSILAALDGTVIAVSSDYSYNSGAGNYIVIDHGNGIATLYEHCGEVYVAVGQQVAAGEVIGEVGSTGYSTGEHLHFEVICNSERIDPLTLKYSANPITTIEFNHVITSPKDIIVSVIRQIDDDYSESDYYCLDADVSHIDAE
ncbi:MAG: M23 family metallopeptidase [Oscillospiraceae bacterium]